MYSTRNTKTTKNTYYGNRGMGFESDLNITNEFYLKNNIAIIHKKPTPITIVDVDYKSRRDAVITKAYFKVASTTDYNGIYKGKYIDFEAKETKNKTGFPLSNIHTHQIEHLKKICEHGGIGFIIVNFTQENLIFLLDIKELINFLNTYHKSIIPLSYFKEHGYLISVKYAPRIDYLNVVDKVYFEE